MSKKSKKSGQIHKCKNAEVVCQTDQGLETAVRSSSKPNLDQRDNKADPTRKSSGPKRKQSRVVDDSKQTPSTPQVTPPAMGKKKS